MVNEDQLRLILSNLESVKNINGDVVEFGCNVGTTSVFIQKLLNGRKGFHVYDSFEGFPEKDQRDEGAPYHFKFEKGACAIPEGRFKETFNGFSLPLPVIHKGWFKDAIEIPEQISFAFFDSDFYTSILDSWEKVYPRLTLGAKVCVHDYDWNVLPGVKMACDDFLRYTSESGTIVSENYIGIFTKL